MSADMLNELYEVVVNVCDNLYASKELINRKTVKRLVVLHGEWADADLEHQIPKYINQWRLQNLMLDDNIHGASQIMHLESQLSKYRDDLLHAKQLIQKLKNDLRGLLNAQ